jgi:hypothetical protein
MSDVYISRGNVYNPPSDGNCGFAALAYLLGHNASALRAIATQYIHLLAEQPPNDWVEKMSKDGTWCDEYTISVIALHFSICINIIYVDAANNTSKFSINDQRRSTREITLINIANTHFMAVTDGKTIHSETDEDEEFAISLFAEQTCIAEQTAKDEEFAISLFAQMT